MQQIVSAQDYLNAAEQLVLAISLAADSLTGGEPIQAVAESVNDKIDSARSVLEEVLDKFRSIEAEQKAEEKKKEFERIKETVGNAIGPMIEKAWRKSLLDAEEAAAAGDEEAAKDAEAWCLWIDMRDRHAAAADRSEAAAQSSESANEAV